jgi:hypothetical protein
MAHKVSARTVLVPKPPGLTYGDAMSCLRIWLDHHKMATIGFKITNGGFEITFSTDADATRLEAFAWPHRARSHPNA